MPNLPNPIAPSPNNYQQSSIINNISLFNHCISYPTDSANRFQASVRMRHTSDLQLMVEHDNYFINTLISQTNNSNNLRQIESILRDNAQMDLAIQEGHPSHLIFGRSDHNTILVNYVTLSWLSKSYPIFGIYRQNGTVSYFPFRSPREISRSLEAGDPVAPLTSKDYRHFLADFFAMYNSQTSFGYYDPNTNEYYSPFRMSNGVITHFIVPWLSEDGSITMRDVGNYHAACYPFGRNISIRSNSHRGISRLFYSHLASDGTIQHTDTALANTDYFGVELECVPAHPFLMHPVSQAAHQPKYDEFFLSKRDGSLPPEGLEIVSRPATLEAQRHYWSQFLSTYGKHLRSSCLTSTGGHIHISRHNLSPMTLAKMSHLLLNLPETTRLGRQNIFPTLFGRTSTNYTNFQYLTERAISAGLDSALQISNSYIADRYVAFNLSNPATVELRAFKGTTNFRAFMKNLEVAASLVQFCRETNIKEISPDSYLSFISQRASQYPDLYDYCIVMGLIDGDTTSTAHDFMKEGF